MTELNVKEPTVWLAPEDSATARVAGADFARALAGAPPEAFMFALGEQEEMIRTAVRKAGYGARKARLAAGAFTSAARVEWGRIAPAFGSGGQWGRA